MTSGRKKRRITYLFFYILILFFSFSAACSKTDQPAERPQKQTFTSGPIIDTGIRDTFKKEIKNIEDPAELAHLGDKYFESKRYLEAIEAYEKTLKLDPKDIDTYNDLGLALHYTGRPDKAIAILREGTEIDPSFQRVWLSLGFVLTVTDRDEEAKTALQKAVDLNPDSTPGQEAKRILGLFK